MPKVKDVKKHLSKAIEDIKKSDNIRRYMYGVRLQRTLIYLTLGLETSTL